MVSLSIKPVVAGAAALALAASLAVTPASAEHGHHGAAIAGALGGFAAGAIVGGALSGPGYYGPAYEGYYAPSCGYVRQPVYDNYGDFVGYRNVPAC